MKKLLLAGILLVSGVAFSADPAVKVEEKLDVTAEVVKGLTITTTPLDFGLVPQGGKGFREVTPGTIALTGEKDRKVLLSFFDTVEGGTLIDDNRVHLKGPNRTDGSTHYLTAALKIDGTDLTSFNNVILAGAKGEKNLKVTGTLDDINADAPTGKYNGAVKIAATYEYNTGK